MKAALYPGLSAGARVPPIVSLSFRLIEVFARIISVPVHCVFVLSNISSRPEIGRDRNEPVPPRCVQPSGPLAVTSLTFLVSELCQPRQDEQSQSWSQHVNIWSAGRHH